MSHAPAQIEQGPPRSPLAEVWSIAWPTVLTMVSYTSMQFVDKLMVGQIGSVELAAQGNGGIWSFALLAFALGIVTVVNTYVSQNLGAGTPRNGPKYAWAAMWLGLGLWLAFMVPYALALPWLFSDGLKAIFSGMEGHSLKLIELESQYAQILVFGSLPLLAARGMNQFFFGLHRPRVVTLAALAGNVTNITGNFILIYGEAGLPALGIPGIPGTPAMGVIGAAIATVIGTCVELAIPLWVFLGPGLNRELGTRAAWRLDWKPIGQLLRLGWPAAIQWGNELICWAIFMAILVGSFGDDHMTACTIAFGFMHLSFMPAVGLSVAVNALVGRYIGAGQPDVAVARANLCLKMAMAWMTVCAAVFLIFRHQLIGLFLNPEIMSAEQYERIVQIGARLMICTAVFQTVDAFGIIYTGALRGAGDTVWPGVVTAIYSWAFIIGLGWLFMTLAPDLKSLGPWIACAIYVIIYGVTMWHRFKAGHWRSIRLLDPPGARYEAAQVAPLPAPPELEAQAASRDLAEGAAEVAAKR